MSTMRTAKPPTQVIGSYLLDTLWSKALNGKMSCSTKFTNSKAATPATIVHMASDLDDA